MLLWLQLTKLFSLVFHVRLVNVKLVEETFTFYSQLQTAG